MAHHVSHEDRIKAVAWVLSRPHAKLGALSMTDRLPHHAARVLAEQVLEALAALENPPPRE